MEAVGRRRQGLAVQLSGDAGEVVQSIGAVGHIVAHGRHGVPAVHGVDPGQPLRLRPHRIGQSPQIPASLRGRQRRPSRLGFGGHTDGLIHHRSIGQGHLGHRLAGARRNGRHHVAIGYLPVSHQQRIAVAEIDSQEVGRHGTITGTLEPGRAHGKITGFISAPARMAAKASVT